VPFASLIYAVAMEVVAPADRPHGGLMRRAWAPLLAGSALAAGAAYVGTVTPRDGRTIACPFHAVTGLWCPGCGLTRGLHRLVRGDLLGALSFNVFVPLVVAAVTVAWWSWFAGRAWARPLVWPARVPIGGWIGLCAVFVVYGVLRNLGPFEALAP